MIVESVVGKLFYDELGIVPDVVIADKFGHPVVRAMSPVYVVCAQMGKGLL